jgi:hypothetical protein
MSAVLDAITCELAALRLRTDCLEQVKDLLGPLYDLPEATRSSGPENTTPKPTRVPVGSVSPTLEETYDYILNHGPIRRGDLIRALGGKPDTTNKRLKRLLENRRIVGEGPSGQRRYRCCQEQPESVPPIEAPQTSPPTALPDRGVYPLYDAIVDLGGATTQQLMARTGLPANLVVEQGRRLMQLGLIRFTGVGESRMWLPAQSELLRDAA